VSSVPSASRPSKSKKKRSTPSIAGSGGGLSGGDGGSIGAQGENTGRWTAEEHRLFLQGLELHGKGWKKIASLIKSRTVVQIRTHAQKYFQKLTKARQNGEEGEIAMEGRGGAASVTAVSPSAMAASSKRRHHSSGTKRKVIQSVVASAQRQGKRFGVVGPDGSPLPTAAPALAHFVMPVGISEEATNGYVPSITAAQGTISGPALEDSLYVLSRTRAMNFAFPIFKYLQVFVACTIYFFALIPTQKQRIQVPLPNPCSSAVGTSSQRCRSFGGCQSYHVAFRYPFW